MANTQILIQEEGRGYIGHALDYDAAGKGFLAVANADPNNANVVLVKVYRAERGQPFNPTPIDTMIPTWKVDAVQMTHTGNNLVVSVTTHEPGEAPRTTMVETRVVAGVWTTTAGFEAERGGAGGFTGGPQEPNGGEPVDYNHIKTDTENIVGANAANSLVKQITTGNQSVRQAIRGLDKDAMRQMIDKTNTEPIAQEYQYLLGQFIKDRMYECLVENGLIRPTEPKKQDSPAVGSGPKE